MANRMPSRLIAVFGLLLAPPMLWASGPSIFSQKKAEPSAIPIQHIAEPQRETVRQILEKPTLFAKSPSEAFSADAEAYQYFLDNPDRAVFAWRKLGAKCVSIQNHGNQQFSYADDSGTDIAWKTVLSQRGLRVWYAEGKVKPGPLLPVVPVKVVVVLRSTEVTTKDGQPGIEHHTEMAVHTDSKTAAVVTKVLGPSAQRMAEQGLSQFQFFFGGLSYYVSRHPEQGAVLMRDVSATATSRSSFPTPPGISPTTADVPATRAP